MSRKSWTRFATRCLGGGLALLALAPASAAAQSDDIGVVWDKGPGGERYVAVGDSAASGPAIPNQRDDPLACERSDRNFPTIAAELLDVTAFRDVTCASALAPNFWKPQENPNGIPGLNPPQFDALGRDTTLVTVGPIGANDFNLVGVGISCINPAPPPTGTSCKDAFEADGSDPNLEAIRKLRPKFRRIMRGVNRRAPNADVFVVGYGQYFTPGGCWPYVPVYAEDADYIQSLVDRIDASLKRAARRGGAKYISLQGHGAIDHTMCALPGEQWITQLTDPLSNAGVLAHPTGRGMAAFGEIVADRVERSRAG